MKCIRQLVCATASVVLVCSASAVGMHQRGGKGAPPTSPPAPAPVPQNNRNNQGNAPRNQPNNQNNRPAGNGRPTNLRQMEALPPKFVEKLQDMSPEKQERFLQNNERFRNMSPERQA